MPGTRRKLTSFGRRAGALAAETSCATAGKLSGCRGFPGGCGGRQAGRSRGSAGGRAGAGPCRGATLGSDARRRGRAAASVQCARAAAGVRVPAFPFLPAAPLAGRTASGPVGSGSSGRRGEARSGMEAEEWQRPAASGPRTALRSPSGAGSEQAARRPRLPEAAGPARRPPRLFPLSLHPLLCPARPARKPDRFAAAKQPAVGPNARVGAWEIVRPGRCPQPRPRAGVKRLPEISRILQSSRASRLFSESRSLTAADPCWVGRTPAPGHQSGYVRLDSSSLRSLHLSTQSPPPLYEEGTHKGSETTLVSLLRITGVLEKEDLSNR